MVRTRRYFKQIIVSLLVAAATVLQPAGAASLTAPRALSDSLSVTIPFSAGKSGLEDPALIARLRQFSEQVLTRPDILRISVVATASPEGSYTSNEKLAQSRADEIINFMIRLNPSLTRGSFETTIIPEDWEGLADLLEESGQPWKDKAVNIARNTPLHIYDSAGRLVDSRKKQMMECEGSTVWFYCKDNCFAKLRRTVVSVVYAQDVDPMEIIPDLPSVGADLGDAGAQLLYPETDERIDPALLADNFTVLPMAMPVIVTEDTKTIFALKTNLLYDVVSVVNFGVEVPLGKCFSLLYEHVCPWWLSDDNKHCLEVLLMGGEARWWFAPKPRPKDGKRRRREVLMGHFIGAYGLYGKGDIQWDTHGLYQVEDMWSAGLTYGFAVPLGRRMNMEFSISGGYARIPYQHYIPTSDWQTLLRDNEDAGIVDYWGPTKLQVTLVWPIRVKTRVKN